MALPIAAPVPRQLLFCFSLDDPSAKQERRDGMEGIQGRRALNIDARELARRLAGYDEVALDLGTGDGRYVRAVALAHPERFVIGVDACRENLREVSRRAPPNALYLIANALELPGELDGLASRLTINFPWGSLLAGLLDAGSGLPQRLASLVRPGATVEVRLNAGALAEAGCAIDDGGRLVRRALASVGFEVGLSQPLGPAELRALPTTWAHRLAFGRDPRALYLRATWMPGEPARVHRRERGGRRADAGDETAEITEITEITERGHIIM
jgi:16S rRNA (adenine(1408)-N(1))-methyltransferase